MFSNINNNKYYDHLHDLSQCNNISKDVGLTDDNRLTNSQVQGDKCGKININKHIFLIKFCYGEGARNPSV